MSWKSLTMLISDDIAWYTSTLIRDVINMHARIKSKLVKRQSVPYMNSELWKAIYSRNMARNKYRKFGAKFWSENRRQRNKVVPLRKKSMSKYFDNKCKNQDTSFWQTISPFFSDKKFRNGNNNILRKNDNTIVDSREISEVFNDYFSSLASNIGFSDEYFSASEAIAIYQNHPSVIKIRDSDGDTHGSLEFHPVAPSDISKKLKNVKNPEIYRVW